MDDSTAFTDTHTLGEARDWLRQRINDGARCPCCTQWAQAYFRSINSGMAYGAIQLYNFHLKYPWQFAHLPSLGRRSSEESKLRYWGLVEEQNTEGHPGGYWRLTQKGIDWVEERIKVPHYVRVFDSRALSRPQSQAKGDPKPDIGIRDALGTDFDYDKLMRGEA